MTYNFRKGDVVTIRATVRYGSDIAGDGRVSLDLGYSGVTVDANRVEIAVPHFNVGETVVIGGGITGTVLGALDGHIWVKHDTPNGNFGTYLAQDLRLARALSDTGPVDPAPAEAPLYVSPGTDEHGQTLADRTPDLPHLADALAES